MERRVDLDGASVSDRRPSPGSASAREEMNRYLDRLSALRATVRTRPCGAGAVGRPSRPVFPAVLVHSLLGPGLRDAACARRRDQNGEVCVGSCEGASACAVGQLLETRPAGSDAPLRGLDRIPAPLVIRGEERPFREDEPMQFGLVLLGQGRAWRDTVERAVASGFAGGAGSLRVPHSVEHVIWKEERIPQVVDRGPLRLRFASPLRLVRRKRELLEFDLPSLLRDLNMRAAIWGHYHEGIEFAPPWHFLADDAERVRLIADHTRVVSIRRYSARQRRVLRHRGLLGWVVLDGVSDEVRRLLHVASIAGAGKGSSVGLGDVQLDHVASAPFAVDELDEGPQAGSRRDSPAGGGSPSGTQHPRSEADDAVRHGIRSTPARARRSSRHEATSGSVGGARYEEEHDG